MKIIITSGGMQVPIDNVRTITNTSTGKLGCVFAEEFSKDYEVVYLHTSNALIPKDDNISLIEVNNADDLLERIKKNLEKGDVIIHLMAVSDFKYEGYVELETLAQEIVNCLDEIKSKDDIEKIINSNLKSKDKLSSKKDVALILSNEIKILKHIKEIQKDCKLVSFKLQSNISEEELVNIVESQIKDTKSDIVVGNLVEKIDNNKHEAIIVSKEKKIKVSSKKEIAKKIKIMIEGVE